MSDSESRGPASPLTKKPSKPPLFERSLSAGKLRASPVSSSSGNGEHSRKSSDASRSQLDVYGYLVTHGYNNVPSSSGTHSRYRLVYEVRKRRESNGLKPAHEFDLSSLAAKKAIADQYTVTYFSEKGFGSVVEYKKDSKTDMFQIGRSTESAIDFIVMDTAPGEKHEARLSQSTISRFACRIVADRTSSSQTRIFAAAFDTSKRIFLNESCPQWSNTRKFSDGLTSNGVLVLTPNGSWGPQMTHGPWREVSVGGEVYGLRYSRSARQRGKAQNESNVLQDGSLIDLCGVVLLWRSPEGMARAPKIEDLASKRDMINALKAQCPVGLTTLRFPSGTNLSDNANPHVYTNCGHVHGYHHWGARPTIAHVADAGKQRDKRVCPFCKETGYFVRLQFGMEPAFYIDNGPATHAFVPCGHITTEATVKYWSRVPLPLGKDQFHAACPFCALPLEGSAGYVKLIFQTHSESMKETLL